jgi:hypothetical protein
MVGNHDRNATIEHGIPETGGVHLEALGVEAKLAREHALGVREWDLPSVD